MQLLIRKANSPLDWPHHISIATLIRRRGLKRCVHAQSKEKAKIRIRYNQIPHPTTDTLWESDETTINHNGQGTLTVKVKTIP